MWAFTPCRHLRPSSLRKRFVQCIQSSPIVSSYEQQGGAGDLFYFGPPRVSAHRGTGWHDCLCLGLCWEVYYSMQEIQLTYMAISRLIIKETIAGISEPWQILKIIHPWQTAINNLKCVCILWSLLIWYVGHQLSTRGGRIDIRHSYCLLYVSNWMDGYLEPFITPSVRNFEALSFLRNLL